MQTRKALLSLFIISILSIAFILINPALIKAQDDLINEGVTWLLSNQNTDGSWSEGSRKFLDTYTALETLLLLNINNAQVSQAISWVGDQDPNNTDDLAHKVLLLSMAGEDTSSDLSTLLTFQSSDNGWGVDQDFSSEVIDTTLALQALKAVNYSDLDTISYALDYLLSTQNTDGGWGFYEGDESNVYMAALVLKVLSSYSSTFDVQGSIDNAVLYLLTKQNADGGFPSTSSGQGSGSTVYGISLSFETLIKSDF